MQELLQTQQLHLGSLSVCYCAVNHSNNLQGLWSRDPVVPPLACGRCSSKSSTERL